MTGETKKVRPENWRGGRIVAVLPMKTLVQDCYHRTYHLIDGGFLNSDAGEVSKDSKVISFDITDVDDGTAMAYLDKEPL